MCYVYVYVCALAIEDVAKVKVMLHGRQFSAARYGVTFVYHFRLCFGKMSDAFVFRCSERINKKRQHTCGSVCCEILESQTFPIGSTHFTHIHARHRVTKSSSRTGEGGKTACPDSIYLQHWTRLINIRAINGHVNCVPAVSAELHTNGSK